MTGSVCMRLTREDDKRFSLFTKVPRERVARMLEEGWKFTTKNRYRRARRDAAKREARKLYGGPSRVKPATTRAQAAPYSWKKGEKKKAPPKSLGRGVLASLASFVGSLFPSVRRRAR